MVVAGADGVSLAGEEAFVVGGGEESGKVVVKPPGEFGALGVAEVHDGIFVSREDAFRDSASASSSSSSGIWVSRICGGGGLSS